MMVSLVMLSGCFFQADEVKTLNLDRSKFGGSSSTVSVSNIEVKNDQLVVHGTNLDGVTQTKIKGGSIDQVLSVVSKTSSKIVYSSASTLALVLNSAFDLIFTDAHGAAVVSVTFNLVDSSVSTAKIGDNQVTTAKIADGAITAAKLSSMSAGTGQVLKYNGTTWIASDLGALTYAGTWDASTGTEPNNAPSGGEYYIVTVADTGVDLGDGAGPRNWAVGDWIIYNGVTTQWDKIDNASYVTSFNSRPGAVTPAANDYTWAQIDKTSSPIGDLSNVNTTGAVNGSVLKFDGSDWVVGTDDDSGVSANSVSSSAIADGAVTNDDINASAAIDYSKLNIADGDLTIAKTNNLQTTLDSKLPLAGGTMTGTLNMGANNITISGTVDGVDVSTLATTVAGKENAISAGTTAQYYRGDKSFQTLDTDAVAEGSNEYHTTARARSAAVVNSTAGSETDQAASVAAMKSYVTANAGTGDFLADGSVNMTGALNLNSNALTNGTSGTFSGNVTAGVLRPADTASDSNFWELQEDGSNRFLLNYNSSQQALITTDGKLHITEICDEAGANCKDASGAWSSSAGTVTSVSGGAGLSDGPITTTGSLSVNVDDSTIEINTDALRLKDGGITNAKINATAAIAYSKLNIADNDLTIAKTSGLQTALDAKALASRSIAAGDGLTGGGDLSADRTLAVNVDDSTIEINTDTLRVKDSGITNAKINSVADSKITTSCSDNQVLKASSGSFVCAEDTSGSSTLETKSADYTVTTSDNNKVLLVSGETTLTLPAAASAGSGFSLTVKKTDSSNKVTIDGDSTETIDGEEEKSLETQYAFTKIVSDGSNWFIVAQNGTIGNGALSCPTGFIAVTGNGTLGTSDFCVMQFEARNVSSTPRSNDADASSSPWVSINATTAQSECESMSEGGFSGTFTLISNPEWMTIARDIEGVASNWSGASVGSGHIPRGHTDNSPSSALAITSTADSYDGTGNNSGQAAGSGWEQKRTHSLSNGSTIWDFSGNVWEWVDWDSGSAGFTTGPTNGTASWQALTSLSGSVTANDLQSSGGYTSSQSFGQWYGGSGGAALRGGDWGNGAYAGAFTLYLSSSTADTSTNIGFRCVYRP
jgi:hypothetical protein